MSAHIVNLCKTGLGNCLESLGLASWGSSDAGNVELATSDQAGLTLIEAMAALAIFAIGSLGILSLFLGSFAMSAQNQNLTSGYEIAQSAVGVLRANGANALSLDGATVNASQASNTLLSPVSQVMSAYGMPPKTQVNLGVTSLNNNGQCPCTATVSVSWGNVAQTYTTQTIVGY